MALPLTPEQEAWAVLLNDPTSDLGKAFAAVLSRNFFLGTINEQLLDSQSAISLAVKAAAGAPNDATPTYKGAVALAGDLGGTAASPTVKSAAGLTFKTTNDEPTISNDATVGGNVDGGPVRIGNHKGQLRVIPFTDGVTYIQSTQSQMRFSGLNGSQGSYLGFDYANTNFTGTLTVTSTTTLQGAVTVPAPTAASNPTTKSYVDNINTTLGGRITTAEGTLSAATASNTGNALVKRFPDGAASFNALYVAQPPTGSDHVTRKDYVDGKIDNGLELTRAGLPATPAAGKVRWYVSADETKPQIKIVDSDGLVRRANHDWGSGTALPSATAAVRGDTYYLTNVGSGCMFIHNGTAWRQVETPTVASAAAMNTIAVAYRGFKVYRSDLGYEMEYQTSTTGWTRPWTTHWGIVSGAISATSGWNAPNVTATGAATYRVDFTSHPNRRYRVFTQTLFAYNGGVTRTAYYTYGQFTTVADQNTAVYSTGSAMGHLFGGVSDDWVNAVDQWNVTGSQLSSSITPISYRYVQFTSGGAGTSYPISEANLVHQVVDWGPVGAPL